MTTEKLLKAMAKDAFGPTFHQELWSKFQRDVAAGKYSDSEQRYREAMTALPEILSEDKMVLLKQYGDVAAQVREFHGSYGFLAGLYCGFQQYFTSDQEPDGGFTGFVVNDISVMPRMQRHAENFRNLEYLNQLGEQLSEGESPPTTEHVVSVQCGWDQRAHSSSVDGFYCGYRAAMEIVDYIAPESQCKFKMMGKLLSMEYQLGFIRSYAEQERLASA